MCELKNRYRAPGVKPAPHARASRRPSRCGSRPARRTEALPQPNERRRRRQETRHETRKRKIRLSARSVDACALRFGAGPTSIKIHSFKNDPRHDPRARRCAAGVGAAPLAPAARRRGSSRASCWWLDRARRKPGPRRQRRPILKVFDFMHSRLVSRLVQARFFTSHIL